MFLRGTWGGLEAKVVLVDALSGEWNCQSSMSKKQHAKDCGCLEWGLGLPEFQVRSSMQRMRVEWAKQRQR